MNDISIRITLAYLRALYEKVRIFHMMPRIFEYYGMQATAAIVDVEHFVKSLYNLRIWQNYCAFLHECHVVILTYPKHILAQSSDLQPKN
jgi:hypothetical protein